MAQIESSVLTNCRNLVSCPAANWYWRTDGLGPAGESRGAHCFGVAAHHSAAPIVTVDSELLGSGPTETPAVGHDSRSATRPQQAQVLLVDILYRH
jgi:hypothetical protein